MIFTCVFCWSTVFLTYITLTNLLLVQNKNVLLSVSLRCKNRHDSKFAVIGGIRAASDDKIVIMTRFSDDTFHGMKGQPCGYPWYTVESLIRIFILNQVPG